MAPPAVPPPPPPPPPQSAPVAVGSIAARTVDAGQTFTVDVSSNFRDPDGDALTYAAESSDERVATARATGSQVSVAAVGPGTATVTVTASDPGGRTARQSFEVAVHGSFDDDFGSAGSLNDWTARNDAGISVGGGVLSVTNRTQGRLGIAERASTPTLNSWTVAARMGRTTRKASPGVVSVTGHRRFTAARLVLRTLDDSGKDRSADASRTSGNFEFALFDRDTREWVRIANMSGGSVEVREAPNEFTDVSFGHEGLDFVGYAGAGNAEALFRFDMRSSTVDGVALGDILEHVTAVWLVNQADAGLTALHDWVEVTGTGSSAAMPDVAEVAEALDAATRSASVAGPDADRAVLEAFYEATGGPSWTNNGGWLTNAPLDDWHGVTMNGDRVGGLILEDNDLTGEIPAELGDLTSLTILNLRFNGAGLTGEIPPRLGGLADLRRLLLSYNGLTGEIPAELGNLANLEWLNLQGNRLTGEIPAELGDLANLVALIIGNNELTGEIPAELGDLANLEWLWLENGSLTGEIPPELGDLTNLTRLYLRRNELTGQVPPELGNLASLNELLLDGNRLRGQLPASFPNLPLTRFWWDENAALCAPDTSAFQAWLAGIEDHRPGASCVEGPEAVGTVPAQTLDVGQSATVDMSPYFRDSDGDPLTYATSSSHPSVATATMSGTALTVTGAGPGTATVTVTAADPAGLSATQTVAVTVTTPNRAPEPTGTIPAITLSVGGRESVDVSSYFRDPDGDALGYTVSSSNASVGSASMSGTVMTVTGVAVGSATVTVTAADPAGLTATQTVAVTVRAANRAPQPVGTIPSISLAVGGSQGVDVSSYFRDPDGDALTYTAATSNAAVVSAAASGSNLTVAGVAEGTATVTVTARDPGGLTASQSVAVSVSRAAAPDLVFTRVDPQAITVAPGSQVVVEFTIRNDGNGASSATNSRAHESSDATITTSDRVASGAIRVEALAPADTVTLRLRISVPAGATAGTTYFGMCVDPVAGESNTANNCSGAARLTISASNRAPQPVGTIPAIGLTVGERQSVDISSYFRDPDGDALAYRVSWSHTGVVSASISGTLMTVAGRAVGSATVTVTAADPAGLTATQAVTVTVRAANRAPEAVGTIPAQTLAPGDEASLDVSSYFRDPDGDPLTYTASSSNSGVVEASMGVADNRLLLLYADAEGTATVTVTAADPSGLTATQTVTVTVRTANRAPEAVGTIPSQTLEYPDGETSLDVSSYFRDPDGDPLTYTASSSNDDVVVATMWVTDNRLLVLNAGEEEGTATVTVTATDPSGLSATQSVSVTVGG